MAETVTFTPFERLFGVFSVGNLAVYCATVDYVPGPSPVVEDHTAKALALTFGMRGGPLEFTSFAALKEALAAVDAQELFFDVKDLFNTAVDAMEMFGQRNDAWDACLKRALRQRAAFRAVAAIPREPLDELFSELNVFHDDHNDYARLSSRAAALSLGAPRSVHRLAIDATPTIVTAAPDDLSPDAWHRGYFDDYARDYELNAFRVAADRPPRMCPKGQHQIPMSFDYCGECAVFFDDTYFCKLCNTPTKKDLALRGLCRGWPLRACPVRRRQQARQSSRVQPTLEARRRISPRAEQERPRQRGGAVPTFGASSCRPPRQPISICGFVCRYGTFGRGDAHAARVAATFLAIYGDVFPFARCGQRGNAIVRFPPDGSPYHQTPRRRGPGGARCGGGVGTACARISGFFTARGRGVGRSRRRFSSALVSSWSRLCRRASSQGAQCGIPRRRCRDRRYPPAARRWVGGPPNPLGPRLAPSV